MSTKLHRPRIDGRTGLARLLAREKRVTRMVEHAERRAAECGETWHGRIWRGMAKDYRGELRALAALIETRKARSVAAASA